MILRARFCSVGCATKFGNAERAAEKSARALEARRNRPPCERCGNSIPESIRMGARFCGIECQQAAAHDARNESGSMRAYMRRYLYGLTDAEFQDLLDRQDGRCAICRSDAWPGKGNRPHVDHDHATGKVRGLLCGKCNTGVGQMDDDPERLRAAADYLERHQT